MPLWIKKTSGTTQSSWANSSNVWVKTKTGTTQSSWSKVKKMYVKTSGGIWSLFYPKAGPFTSTSPAILNSSNANITSSSVLRIGTQIKGTTGVWNPNGYTINNFTIKMLGWSAQSGGSKNTIYGPVTISATLSAGSYSGANTSFTLSPASTYDKQYIDFDVIANTTTTGVTGEDSTGATNRIYIARNQPVNLTASFNKPSPQTGDTLTYTSTWNGNDAYTPENIRSSITWYRNTTKSLTNATPITSGLTISSPTNDGTTYTVTQSYPVQSVDIGNYIFVVDQQFNSGTDYDNASTSIGVKVTTYTNSQVVIPVPNAPINLSRNLGGGTSKTFTWSAPSGGSTVSGYRYQVNNLGWIDVGSSTSVSLTMPTGSSTFSVVAYNSTGQGNSISLSLIIPTISSGPNTNAIVYNMANVYWTATNQYSWSLTGVGPNSYGSQSTSVNSQVVSNLTAGTTYTPVLTITSSTGDYVSATGTSFTTPPSLSGISAYDATNGVGSATGINISSNIPYNTGTVTWTNGSNTDFANLYSVTGAGSGGAGVNPSTLTTSGSFSIISTGTASVTIRGINNHKQAAVTWSQSAAQSYSISYNITGVGNLVVTGNSSSSFPSVILLQDTVSRTLTINSITVYSGLNQTGRSTTVNSTSNVTPVNTTHDTLATGSVTYTTPIAPGTPSPTATIQTATSVLISWTAPSAGSSAIDLYEYNYDNTGWNSNGTSTSVTINNPSIGSQHTVQVRAHNATAGYGSAGSVSFTINVPSAPAPTASNILQHSATVSWTTPTAGSFSIDFYEVMVSPQPGGGTPTWSSVGLVNSTSVSGLNAGSSYTVSVRAHSSAGYSNSGSTSFTTLANTVPGTPAPSASGITSSTATISWQAVSDGGSTVSYTYSVTGSINTGGFINNNITLSGTTYSVQLTGLPASGSFTVTVKATNSVGSSTGSVSFQTTAASTTAATTAAPTTAAPTTAAPTTAAPTTTVCGAACQCVNAGGIWTGSSCLI